MPIRSMPKTPVLDLFYQTAETPEISNLTNEDLADIQKEQENRLLGTMGMQSIFLMLAIMLYETWEWSQFEIIWQSAMMYGMFAFCFQAALYLTYRSVFEDSTNYRRQIKRLKAKNKRKMSQLKYQVDKQRTEWLLEQQMAQFASNMEMAQADNQINPTEAALLDQQYNNLQQTAQQTGVSMDELAKQLGVDRHRVAGIPVGPNLTITQPPLQHFQIPNQENLENN